MSSAGARECSALSNERCSLVCTPTFGGTWGRYLQTPLCLGLSLRCRPLAYGQARLRSRTRGWSRFYSPTSGLLSRRLGAAAPSPPLSAALGLSCRRLATAGSEALGRWRLPPPRPHFPLPSACLADGSLLRATTHLAGGGCRPHTPAFQCARLVLQTARYRGQRSAWQVGAAAPRPRFPLPSACLADGSLLRATKRLAGGGSPGRLKGSAPTAKPPGRVYYTRSLMLILRAEWRYFGRCVLRIYGESPTQRGREGALSI